jgi:hypothetical protein
VIVSWTCEVAKFKALILQRFFEREFPSACLPERERSAGLRGKEASPSAPARHHPIVANQVENGWNLTPAVDTAERRF